MTLYPAILLFGVMAVSLAAQEADTSARTYSQPLRLLSHAPPGFTAPQLIGGHVEKSDFVRFAQQFRSAPFQARAHFDVDVDGRVKNCAADRQGDWPDLYKRICFLVTKRCRFVAGTDPSGQPARLPIELVFEFRWVGTPDRTR